MGGCSVEGDWELFTSPRTLVLVGKSGNGKSATGNSILGENIFQSKRSASGVTQTSLLSTAVLKDGQMLNVIDTPGLFDSCVNPEFVGKEIVSCINMASDGIHAVLFVLSVCVRFSEEEEAAIRSLVALFGKKISDYMIVVFTGGDELEEGGKTLEEFLCGCPASLKEILCQCGNRCVLFDNRTKDETKKGNQVHQLFSLVNMVLRNNGGEPYTNEIFTEVKKGTRELQDQTEKFQALKGTNGSYTQQELSVLLEQIHDKQFKRILEMVESKFKEITLKLEQLLTEERAARVKAEKEEEAALKKSEEDMTRMVEELEKQWESKEKKRHKREEEKRKWREVQERNRTEQELRRQFEHGCVTVRFNWMNMF